MAANGSRPKLPTNHKLATPIEGKSAAAAKTIKELWGVWPWDVMDKQQLDPDIWKYARLNALRALAYATTLEYGRFLIKAEVKSGALTVEGIYAAKKKWIREVAAPINLKASNLPGANLREELSNASLDRGLEKPPHTPINRVSNEERETLSDGNLGSGKPQNKQFRPATRTPLPPRLGSPVELPQKRQRLDEPHDHPVKLESAQNRQPSDRRPILRTRIDADATQVTGIMEGKASKLLRLLRESRVTFTRQMSRVQYLEINIRTKQNELAENTEFIRTFQFKREDLTSQLNEALCIEAGERALAAKKRGFHERYKIHHGSALPIHPAQEPGTIDSALISRQIEGLSEQDFRSASERQLELEEATNRGLDELRDSRAKLLEIGETVERQSKSLEAWNLFCDKVKAARLEWEQSGGIAD
ncbi:hypothetical protein SUNI508_04240 [Seiridium unicorne]|uniref:Uncharacterized protein n=1 Tax=Seiridium unicorne TaxID=138068 RepID=A0ABR2V960_9PEZI